MAVSLGARPAAGLSLVLCFRDRPKGFVSVSEEMDS